MRVSPALIVSILAFSTFMVSCMSASRKADRKAAAAAKDLVGRRAAIGRSINLEVDLIPRNRGRRTWKKMQPRYITIHSTQNKSRGADARRHALALKRGKLRSGRGSGYLTWHYSVDDRRAVQHLLTTEQGEHADYDGPGNRTSIGIEICENRDGNLSKAVDRAAKLAAVMMKAYNIPLNRVVPHYHWPRPTSRNRQWHKPCPRILLDGGRPGRKWQWFLGKVNGYYMKL